MSLRVCTAEYMISTNKGLGFSEAWMPRVVAERMATSGRDGSVDRSPDPVAFIETDLLWTNNTGDAQHLMMSVHRASRYLVVSNPNTLALDDAYTYAVGSAPMAATPTGANNGFGARAKISRSTAATVGFGRMFRDVPDWVSYVEIGLIEPDESVHFRYRALFTTPGEWRAGTSPRHEMNARWTRLRLWASPWVEGSI